MADRVRAGRGVDDRDAVRKSNPLQRAAQVRKSNPLQRAAQGAREQRAGSAETDRMGREQQRRATAYGRARGRL